MNVLAPPKPPVHDDPEALIEEARRRARRRRLAMAAAAVALVLAGVVLAVLELTGGTSTATKVPNGFHLVRARGPVRHALLEDLKSRYQTVDLATGRTRPARLTQEIWWDKRSGLSHTVYRLDGRVLGGWARQGCQGTGSRRFVSRRRRSISATKALVGRWMLVARDGRAPGTSAAIASSGSKGLSSREAASSRT